MLKLGDKEEDDSKVAVEERIGGLLFIGVGAGGEGGFGTEAIIL